MRIFICGDTNSSKGGVVDTMLVKNKCSKNIIDKYQINKNNQNNKIHKFIFNDCYNDAILSNIDKNNKNNKNYFDEFFNRLEWFPSRGYIILKI